MIEEKGIWKERPQPMLHGVDLETYDAEELNTWLENLKAKITQLNECLGEYESHGWCSHCIIDAKCAQITVHVNKLEEDAKRWRKLHREDPDATIDIYEVFDETIEELNFLRDKLEDVKTCLKEAKAQGRLSISQGMKFDDILDKKFERSDASIISRHIALKNYLKKLMDTGGFPQTRKIMNILEGGERW